MSRELEEIVLEKTERDKLIDELTLALLYLTSFTEEGKPHVLEKSRLDGNGPISGRWFYRETEMHA